MKKLEEITGKDIFLICSVRNADAKTQEILDNYVGQLEKQGNKVYYPRRDTNQNDPIGFNICSQNKNAIKNSNLVMILYDKNSQGSLFDIGMVFMAEKPLYAINFKEIEKTPEKSFQNVVLYLHEFYQNREK